MSSFAVGLAVAASVVVAVADYTSYSRPVAAAASFGVARSLNSLN